MAAPPACPACNTPLGLFTPREAEAHVNACLDTPSLPVSLRDVPECAVCGRDLSSLTDAAREEHANRCADSLLPLCPVDRNPRGRGRARAGGGRGTELSAGVQGRVGQGQQAAVSKAKGDGRVEHLLTMLGLQRYAARFAREEIDLVALRLLSEDDLAALSVPEAARRHIANAMHSVEILAELQRVARQSRTSAGARRNTGGGGGNSGRATDSQGEQEKAQEEMGRMGREGAEGESAVADEGDVREGDHVAAAMPAPTQRFEESRLRSHLGRLNDGSDEDEYIPSVRAELPQPREAGAYSPPPPPLNSRTDGNDGRADVMKDVVLDNDGSTDCGSRLRAKSTGGVDSRGTCNGGDIGAYGGPAGMVGMVVSGGDDIGSDSGRRSLSRGEASASGGSMSSSSLRSDLADVERAMGATSQISLEGKLRKWRRRRMEREKQRHLREVAKIDELYTNELRRVVGNGGDVAGEGYGEEAGGVAGVETSSAVQDEVAPVSDGEEEWQGRVMDSAVIDLTMDGVEVDSGGGVADVCVVSSGSAIDGGDKGSVDRQATGVESAAAICIERIRKGNGMGNGMTEALSPSSSSSSSVAPIDFGELQRRTDQILSRQDDESDDGDERPGPSRGLGAGENGGGPEAGDERPGPSRGYGAGENEGGPEDGDEEVMDLIGGEYDDDDGNEGNGNGDKEAQGGEREGGAEADSDEDILDLVGPDEDGNEFGSAVKALPEDDDDDATGATQSRLKKRRRGGKVQRGDIIKAIAADSKLHDDVLMMALVPFARVLDAVREAGVNVSKKGMHDFLVKEGILFKGEAPANTQSSQRYMRTLNSDRRCGSD